MLTRVQRLIISSIYEEQASGFIPSNNMYSLVRGVAGFSGNIISLSNGVNTQGFGLVNNALNPTVDSFLASGNGGNEVLGWTCQNTLEVWTFATGNAPKLIKGGDDTYHLDFGDGVGTDNGVHLAGNLFNFIGDQDKSSYILMRQFNSTTRYWGVGQTGNTGGTSAYNGTPSLYKNNTAIANSRHEVHLTLNNGFACLNYFNIVLYNTITYGIGRYGNGGAGSTWAIKGRIKEISTGTVASLQERGAFITNAMERNNVA